MVIAVDFDGTCVKHDYPKIGGDIGAIPVLQKLVENGHKIILYTMRSHKPVDGVDTLAEAESWFKENNIPLYGVNENPDQKDWTDSKKIYANLYIDDAALGVPAKFDEDGNRYVDWNKVEIMLKNILN
jgi:hydroxymethylpyrimidine pyrophosphatase-like HAD family hydrolase